LRKRRSIALSITARMNAGEFRRVLRDDGRLLVGIPAPDDLIELRGAGRDRVARTIETFGTDFKLVDQRRVTTAADLDAAGFDVLLDDREERAGVKFKDADLIGIPYRINVGKKAAEGKVEIVTRATASSQDVAISEVVATLQNTTDTV